MQKEIDPDLAPSAFVSSKFMPYQQKIEYKYYPDSSELTDSEDDNEDNRQAEEQPYETPASIAFAKLLKQIYLSESMKRSDIIISSTLSLSLIPKDMRRINNCHVAKMSHDELLEFVDEKNAFNAMIKEIQYQKGT
jgi:hypothetical protein